VTEKYQVLDIEDWPRKQHFEFYKDFEQPYFNICCDLDAAKLFNYCRDNNIAFFDAYLFLTMKTLNQLTPFCYRMVDGQVRIYQEISISVTVMADDQTLRFCLVPFSADFFEFVQKFKTAKDKALSEPFIDHSFLANQNIKSTVYMSVIPWISFTSFSHASPSSESSGIPRIVFGKMRKTDYSMPLSVEVHHSLVDGLHVGQFVQTLQSFFDQGEAFLV
jgi:chloramphenicol O-acetyltransferase type A